MKISINTTSRYLTEHSQNFPLGDTVTENSPIGPSGLQVLDSGSFPFCEQKFWVGGIIYWVICQGNFSLTAWVWCI